MVMTLRQRLDAGLALVAQVHLRERHPDWSDQKCFSFIAYKARRSSVPSDADVADEFEYLARMSLLPARSVAIWDQINEPQYPEFEDL
jgi:hypothetical protein